MSSDQKKLNGGQGVLGKRGRLFALLTIAAAIIAVLAATYGIIQLTEQRAHAEAEKLVSTVADHINEKMDEVREVTVLKSEEAYKEIDDPDALEKLVHGFVSENDFVYGSTIAFEPDSFPEKGRVFAPYSWRTEDGVVHDRQLGEETDFYEEEWYAETKLSRREYMSEPYFDEGGAKIMMCTFSVPLRDSKGNILAIMTADVGLADLEEYVNTINPYNDSYIVLRSRNGIALANGESEDDAPAGSIIIKGMTEIGWSVELSVPFSYLMRGDTGVLFAILGILMTAFLFVYFINRVLNGLQERSSREYMNVINSMTGSFSSIFLVDLDSDETVTIRDPAMYEDVLTTHNVERSSFTEKIKALIDYDCYRADREMMLREISHETIREKLTGQDRYEIRFRKESDGDIRWYEMHVIALEKDADGKTKRVVVGFADVSDSVRKEKEAQTTLEGALGMAESASRAKTTFLFSMSHDIRTPMNAILGYTDMALRHIDDRERVRNSLTKIKSSGGHLLNLINDILEMSRIESGKLELVEEPLDIREAIRGVENMSQVLATPKSIKFEVTADGIRNPYIFADELHLNEVFINIISNAIKYTGEDGTVKYIVSQPGDPVDGRATYRVEISDNGIGMSEEFQKHIFDTFARERSATVSKQEGTGIGLSIVKNIVDLAGGTIDIKSALGVGTDVVIELPFRVMNEAEIAEFTVNRDESDDFVDGFSLEGSRVLIVEDNEMNREIAEEILSEAGLLVESAEDGQKAVDTVTEKGIGYYDFILMDIQMPVMNGYEATSAIRKMPGGYAVPIIALSANAFAEDRQKSLEAGMNAHVAKPIDVKELFRTMKSLSGGAR